jgi:hypothetical protein
MKPTHQLLLLKAKTQLKKRLKRLAARMRSKSRLLPGPKGPMTRCPLAGKDRPQGHGADPLTDITSAVAGAIGDRPTVQEVAGKGLAGITGEVTSTRVVARGSDIRGLVLGLL